MELDVGQMMSAKNKAVDSLTGGIEYLFKKYKVSYWLPPGHTTPPQTIVLLISNAPNTLPPHHHLITTSPPPHRLAAPLQVDYLKGHGKITGPNGVNVALTEGGSQDVEAKNILIATGSEVTDPLPPSHRPLPPSRGSSLDHHPHPRRTRILALALTRTRTLTRILLTPSRIR